MDKNEKFQVSRSGSPRRPRRLWLVLILAGALAFYVGYGSRWRTVRHSHEEPVVYAPYTTDSAPGDNVTFTLNSYILTFEAGSVTQNEMRSGRTRVRSFIHWNHVYMLAQDTAGNNIVLDWPYGYTEMGTDRAYPVTNPYSSKMFSFVLHQLPDAGEAGIALSGKVTVADTEELTYLKTWGNHTGRELTGEYMQELIGKLNGTKVVRLYLEGDAPETVTVKDPDTIEKNPESLYWMVGGALLLAAGLALLAAGARRKKAE